MHDYTTAREVVRVDGSDDRQPLLRRRELVVRARLRSVVLPGGVDSYPYRVNGGVGPPRGVLIYETALRSDHHMANTSYLTTVVEEAVRAALAERHGVAFAKRRMPLLPGGLHEFDAVAENGSIIASIKAASGRTAGGKVPSGKIKDSIAELYYLSLVQAPRRLLVFTSAEFHEILTRTLRDKIAPGIEVVHIPLPPDVEAEMVRVQQVASVEVTPVLDDQESAQMVGGRNG